MKNNDRITKQELLNAGFSFKGSHYDIELIHPIYISVNVGLQAAEILLRDNRDLLKQFYKNQ